MNWTHGAAAAFAGFVASQTQLEPVAAALSGAAASLTIESAIGLKGEKVSSPFKYMAEMHKNFEG